jgi:hypothetical protein
VTQICWQIVVQPVVSSRGKTGSSLVRLRKTSHRVQQISFRITDIRLVRTAREFFEDDGRKSVVVGSFVRRKKSGIDRVQITPERHKITASQQMPSC